MGEVKGLNSADNLGRSIDAPSAWAPLRRPLFRNLWISSIVTNVGGWMQDTAGTWLMATLTSSPLLIALMQTAASVPILLLGFVSGATADIFDRRRVLIVWQFWMLTASAALAVLTFAGSVTPRTLLLLTFMLYVGQAMYNPAWFSIVPELVPRDEIPEAVSINSAGFNLSRAVGPMLGGLTVAAFAVAAHGAGIAFGLNAASDLAVIFVLYTWHRTPFFKSTLPAERLLGSLRSGVRYIAHSPALQATFIRAFTFTLFASGVWALLAVVARQDLRQGAMGYGILNGCLGLGSIAGAIAMPHTRKRLPADSIVRIASIVYSVTLLLMATVQSVPLIVLSLLAAGFCWTSTTASLNVSVQLSVPAWVQARAVGAYQTIFWAGMSLGSWTWGYIAEHVDTSTSLLIASVANFVAIFLVWRFRLMRGDPPDMTPYMPQRSPVPDTVDPEEGPVLVSIEYCVKAEDYEPFIHAINRLSRVRLRDGASRWGIFRDARNPERLVEHFLMESWMEFLRERERLTESDCKIRECVRNYHKGEDPPAASFMIYARESSEQQTNTDIGKNNTKATANGRR